MSASRREFAKRLAIVAVTAPLLESTPVVAQPPQAPPEAPPPGSKNIRFAEAQTDILRARYGDHITPEDARKIEEDLDQLGGYMNRLREFELHNWDEPDTIFFARGRDE